jgi:hypothetical protein
MRYRILLAAILSCFLFSATAQKANKVFAITADNTNSNRFLWMNISEIDLNTGQVIRPLFERSKTAFDFYDGNTKTKITPNQVTVSNNRVSIPVQAPTFTMVAAAAFDGRRNRLFITPMQIPELRWIDLDDNNTTLKVYTAKLPINATDLVNEAGQITRMAIAADGYGYALTNDANHLIRFSTGRKVTITDLGALLDAPGNNGISVHNKCSSFGGDMISDADGNLYLFSAFHSIFKVDIAAKTATYIGVMKNLPGNYTTNGAAIDENGQLIVSSANSNEGYYQVDMNTWEATKLPGNSKTLSVSDMASSHFAFEKKKTLEISPIVFTKPAIQLNKITVYPNPVTESMFRVSFDNKETGRYLVQVMDVRGRMAMQQSINVGFKNQVVEIDIPSGMSKGMYLVKVLNANGKAMYADKILVD